MTGISRAPWRAASGSASPSRCSACGGRRRLRGEGRGADARRASSRCAPAIVLETAGPPPSDTAVDFAAGEPRVIVLRHGPPENVVFAEVNFAAAALPGGQRPAGEGRDPPRPGVYGLDILTNQPLGEGASVTFKYARYFLAPARARTVFGSDVLYERALAVGRLAAEQSQLALLPSTRPAADDLRAAVAAAGTYLVAAPRRDRHASRRSPPAPARAAAWCR